MIIGGSGNNLVIGLQGEFTDSRDDNVYKYLKIGNQVWMAENLRYLPESEAVGEGTRFDVYNNTSNDIEVIKALDNYSTYGVLYTWSAVMGFPAEADDTDYSGSVTTPHQGICPEGWHIPTDDDFKQLEMAVGMSEAEANSTGWRGSPAGSKLAGDADLWGTTRTIVTTAGFEDSGFMGLPAGLRATDGVSFYYLNVYTNWWSSSQSSSTLSWRRLLYRDYSDVYRSTNNKLFGFSLRCVRDY
jgi:uncharacterized protein (TIGR02145 family)